MSYKLLALTFIVLLTGSVAAQTPSPSKAAEDSAKLEKEAVEFLRETATEVGRMRTMENRISFNSELASLMWFHDEKEAKAMYAEVVGDFKQLLTQFDSQMNGPQNPDDEDAMGGIFGGYGRSKVERKFRVAMEVRKQIAMSLAEHAPDMAFDFFYDTLNLITNAQLKKETEQSDKYFENQLLNQIASTDAAKAVELGKGSIKNGLSYNHIELLKKIYANDADKGVEFGAVILSRLKSEKTTLMNAYLYSSLLSYGIDNFEASKKPGAKKPIYQRDDLRDIAEQFAEVILGGTLSVDSYSVGNYADQIDKFAPGRGAQIRAKFGKNKSPTGFAAVNAVSYASGISSANSNTADDTERIGRENRERVEKLDREAREKAETQMMKDVKDLGTKSLPKEERDKVVAQARSIISQARGKAKKITALSFLAAQVMHLGDKDLANEIMLDAERLVNPQPKNYQDFLLSWMLASGYAEADPEKAFPLLESTILRANDTIAAFLKVAEFIDANEELMDDGEMQVGMFGGSMIRELTVGLGMATGTIRSLAVADFAKMKNLTNTFDRTETRVLAKMLVLRAVMDKKQNPWKLKTEEEEWIDSNSDDPPPPAMSNSNTMKK